MVYTDTNSPVSYPCHCKYQMSPWHLYFFRFTPSLTLAIYNPSLLQIVSTFPSTGNFIIGNLSGRGNNIVIRNHFTLFYSLLFPLLFRVYLLSGCSVLNFKCFNRHWAMRMLETPLPHLSCPLSSTKSTTSHNSYSCSYFADRLITLSENCNNTSESYNHIHVHTNHVRILVCFTYFTQRYRFKFPPCHCLSVNI